MEQHLLLSRLLGVLLLRRDNVNHLFHIAMHGQQSHACKPLPDLWYPHDLMT